MNRIEDMPDQELRTFQVAASQLVAIGAFTTVTGVALAIALGSVRGLALSVPGLFVMIVFGWYSSLLITEWKRRHPHDQAG